MIHMLGMMECKRALVSSEGDIAKAIDWLRSKGIKTAQNQVGLY